MIDEKGIDAFLESAANMAYKRHVGEYGFTMLIDSITMYKTGFKDGLLAAVNYFGIEDLDEKKSARKKPVKQDCSKCRHHRDRLVRIEDTTGYSRVIRCDKLPDFCRKCIDNGWSGWEKRE